MMAIVGSMPVTLANNTLADANQVMADFNYIASQVNSNAAGVAQANNFVGAQTISGDSIATLTAIQTLTQKTLVTPVISGIPTGTVTASTYTPTLTNVVNITGLTPQSCQYNRIGNVVTVAGTVTFSNVTASSSCSFNLSLPVASAVSSAYDLNGSGTSKLDGSCWISGDTVHSEAIVNFVSGGSGVFARFFSFTFMYLID